MLLSLCAFKCERILFIGIKACFLALRWKYLVDFFFLEKNDSYQPLEKSAHLQASVALLPPLISLTAPRKCITSWHLLVRGTSKGHVI